MKVSLEWLREYAALDAPLEVLVQGLVDTGTEVDAVHRGPEGVIVARVVALTPVPESTRGVQFADIDAGRSEPLRLLTGAANLTVGDLVPYAPPGTHLPGMAEPLGVRAMFGGKYESPGMLCSAAELGVGEDAGGIHHLGRGVPGQALRDALALEAVLDVEVTTNRPDCLCHVGIAREMAAAVGETVREPDCSIPEHLLSAASLAQRVDVSVEDPQGCLRFAVRIVENVAVGPSPPWLQRRLRTVGLRPINNVVDVTNYVAHELGQPLHAFDFDRFVAAQPDAERTAHVVVRRGRDEPIACLDGVERRAGPADMTVCAGATAVSMAGVIGGAGTAVDEATRNVLLEAASWDGPTIRATSKRLQVRTDASTLYEKGLSDTLPPLALDRAAALIGDLGGGHVLHDRIDVRARELPAIDPIVLSGKVLSLLLGYHVDATEAATALAHLGFGVEQHGDELVVTPPHFRRDVGIVADVAEEVGRALGYERVPSTLPGRRVAVSGVAAEASTEDLVREVLLGAGYDEAITWSFTSAAAAAALAGVGGARHPIALRDPLSEEWTVLRTSLLPGLVAAAGTNLHRGSEAVRLFELGRAFWEGARRGSVPGATADGADAGLPALPAEPLCLSMVATAEGADAAAAELRHLQAVVQRVATELGGGIPAVSNEDIEGLQRGRSARLRSAGEVVGIIGELSPEALAHLQVRRADRFDVRHRVVVGEVLVEALIPEVRSPRRYQAPPRQPAVVQDLAVTVPSAALAGDALHTIRDAGDALLETVTLYDEFRGEKVGADRKGWTFRLTFRAADRTLAGEEAAALQATIAQALQSRLGAEVRR